MQHWRAGTVIALREYAAAPATNATTWALDPIVKDTENRFAESSTTAAGNRVKELMAILRECVSVKMVVCVQKGRYHFQHTSAGAVYDSSTMFCSGPDGHGARVSLSLWPGLMKHPEEPGYWHAVLSEHVHTVTAEEMGPFFSRA